MEIRSFKPDDAFAVITLWRQVFGYTEPRNDPAISLRRKLAVNDDLLLIALVDGELAGTVMGGYDGHRGWIYSLAVAEPYRRHGVGTALVLRMEQLLAARDCPKINLQVISTNAAVVAFYQKLGYKVEERISMGKVLPHAASA
jgi:ribosomal protein S18 acetylase RimI-like enzyme